MPVFERQQNRSQRSSHLASPVRLDRADSRLAPMRNSFIAQQQCLGNQAVQRLLRSRVIQTKLTINDPRDRYEQEADQVAEQVLHMPEPRAPREEAVSTQAPNIRVQRMCSECEEDAEETLQTKRASDQTTQLTPGVEANINILRDGGQPLPRSMRAFFEPRFGHDFSQVRVRTDGRAAETARAINALAFTVGRDIFFGTGQYQPGTASGQRLLAHELTHVTQQARMGSALQRQEQSRVRFPTLEIAALRGQAAFATGSSPLTSGEISDASFVFGSSIDLSRVRIVYSPVISAPTTLGDTIRVPPAYAMPRQVLIHELAHIWQYQTKGSAYISDSVFHQTAAFITGGNRGAAYGYTIVPGKSFHDYTAEHQASIVEDYFASSSLRTNAEYRRLIGEVRAASPIAAPSAFFEEMAAGLPPRGSELPPRPGEVGSREGVGVPLLEFRFPGL